MPDYSIDTLGKHPQRLGTVEAENERKARSDQTVRGRSKIVVTKVADGDYDETLGLSDGPPARIPLVYFRWAGPNRRST